MTYKAALIGAGIIASRHAQAIAAMEGLKLAAVADVREERAAELCAGKGAAVYTDYRQMLEKEKPDIAVITLPHYLHLEAVQNTAGAGCHMLLEKPMGMNVRECDRMIEAIERSGVKAMVGHTQHYLAENRAAKALADSGELGRLVAMNDTRHGYYFTPDRPAWFLDKDKSGGGIVMNIGSHCIDRMQWLSGGRIRSIRASLTWYGERGDVEGSGVLYAENEHGVAGTITVSGYNCAPKNEYELLFTGGMIRCQGGGGLFVSRGGAYETVPIDGGDDPFVLQFEDLVTYIETGHEPECSLDYARSVIDVVESAYRSHETGAEQRVGAEAVGQSHE
ncbi:Gfo/Idh/MocA family protein [Paenibacillus ginsengarvi]|uniref:Gfo/Idh/MocA family oxidoreductase n=1 Tax=Paenibacillus ginsengarvi TaxID=400777 RepID=A0A3B0CBD3_9BACL|nr:Gfo/Idh/MocA family oxidoreductase [Paenibacillus ginsengarvi]RKN83775.1 gfo/Idh/MocA family oxidoreductase [Paenibacillus ginsengarvi]